MCASVRVVLHRTAGFMVSPSTPHTPPPPPPHLTHPNMLTPSCRRDSTGTNGLEYVVKVILYLLEPTKAEFTASFVGKLIISFVKKVTS